MARRFFKFRSFSGSARRLEPPAFWDTPPCSGPFGPTSDLSVATRRSAGPGLGETQGEIAPPQATSGSPPWPLRVTVCRAAKHSRPWKRRGAPERADVRLKTPWGQHGARQPGGNSSGQGRPIGDRACGIAAHASRDVSHTTRQRLKLAARSASSPPAFADRAGPVQCSAGCSSSSIRHRWVGPRPSRKL
jgi:hypothetical protein